MNYSYLNGIANDSVVSIPLVGMRVKGRILDFCAEITIEKRFENVEEFPIEAVYTFPLMNESSSVHKFNVYIDGKKLEGVVEEKETALNEYEDNIAKGHSAFLLEQVDQSDTMFKASIGNIDSHQEVVIVVGYVTELQFSADQLELVLPSPKTTRSALRGQNHKSIPDGLSVDLSLEMTSSIVRATSPSHPVDFTLTTPTSAAVILEYSHLDSGLPLPASFILNIQLLEPHKPIVRIKDQIAMLTVVPDLVHFDPISEIIFLVDRSGSMGGEKMRKTKDTMQIFLRSLPMGTSFNIVGFGTTFKHLFKQSREYSDSTLALATTHVEAMEADLGGTALDAPLRSILEAETTKGIPRQIFLLTDGEVEHPEVCIELAREYSSMTRERIERAKRIRERDIRSERRSRREGGEERIMTEFYLGSTRIFTFGIHGASPSLVVGIARAGNGKAELITGSENLESKVIAQLRRALQPALTNICIDWGHAEVNQTPKVTPPLFGGSKLTAFAYLPPSFILGKVDLTAQIGKEVFSISIDATTCNSVDDNYNFIKYFAARSSIRDVEDEINVLQRKGENFSKLQEKAIQLSTEHNLLCRYTAFIVINENFQVIYNTMVKRENNSIFNRSGTQTAGGTQKGSFVLIDGQICQVVDMSTSKTGKHGHVKVHTVVVDSSGKKETIMSSSAPVAISLPQPQASPSSLAPPTPLPEYIIMKQRAAGDFSEDVLVCIGKVSLADLYANMPNNTEIQAHPALDQILIAAFVCGLLRVRYTAYEDQWSLVDKKTQTWCKNSQNRSAAIFGTHFDWIAFSVRLAKNVVKATNI